MPGRRQTWSALRRSLSGRPEGARTGAGPGGAATTYLLLVISFGISFSMTAAAAAEIRIGVVNVREVFARYKKAEDLQKEDKEKLEPRRKEFERRQRELRRRAREFGEGDEGTGLETERHREAKEIEHQEYLLKLDYREFQRDVQAANERLMRRLWDDLAAACRRVGEAEGYDLILKFYGADRSATAQGEPATDRERLETLQRDALLYVAPSVDITERVLEVLEKAYRRGIKLVPDDREGDRDGDADGPLEGGHG